MFWWVNASSDLKNWVPNHHYDAKVGNSFYTKKEKERTDNIYLQEEDRYFTLKTWNIYSKIELNGLGRQWFSQKGPTYYQKALNCKQIFCSHTK